VFGKPELDHARRPGQPEFCSSAPRSAAICCWPPQAAERAAHDYLYVYYLVKHATGTGQARPQYSASAARPAMQQQQNMLPGQAPARVSQPSAAPVQPNAYQYQQQQVCCIHTKVTQPNLTKSLAYQLLPFWSYRAKLSCISSNSNIFKPSHTWQLSKDSTASSSSSSSSNNNSSKHMPT